MSSYEVKWHLIWAQMRPHMSSNETHMRFGERWRRTAMWGCVSTLITGGVHIDHPHTTNIAGNSKRLWKFKIRFFSHLRSQMRNRSLSLVENRWKNWCYQKSSFPKIKSYDPYDDQIWAPNSSPARRYLQKRKSSFSREKNLFVNRVILIFKGRFWQLRERILPRSPYFLKMPGNHILFYRVGRREW